jgi:late competence protein required for DNA uptake (superfamily II DNA/RNA helicase)
MKMKCPRCNGFMIYERYQDMLEVFYAWRCVICGEVLDDVVLKNRDEKSGQDKKTASSL